MQKAFFRNAVAMVAALILLRKDKQTLIVKKGSRFPVFMRCACGTAGLICNFYAIDHIPIADANMLNKLSPFFAIIMSYFILSEKADKWEWCAVLIAFSGTLFIVKPTFDMTFVNGLMGVIGGLGAGVAYTFLRKATGNGVSKSLIIFWFATFSCLVTGPYLLIHYTPMTFLQFGSLMLAGMAATGGQFCITSAYALAPAKEISVYDYTQVLFAAVLGILFLQETPDVFSMIGYVIIIGTAVIKWRYQIHRDYGIIHSGKD